MWSALRKNYLPEQYHKLYKIISGHCDTFHKVPTLEELQFGVRDSKQKELLATITAVEVDVEPAILLEYLKNEYTQKIILKKLENYIDSTISFESADENLESLSAIIDYVEDKVDLQAPQESMQRIELFEPQETYSKFLPLGLNQEFDNQWKFPPESLILLGGKRGSGKSITCANIAVSQYEQGKTSIYFTIEMTAREILQRCCSIQTGVPHNRIINRNLSQSDWIKVATWWANRFDGGEKYLAEFKESGDFGILHRELSRSCKLKSAALDVVYDPQLTISKIRAEVDKRMRQGEVGVIVVDYVNKVKRLNMNPKSSHWDWQEQIEISNALKLLAQEYCVPVVSPYQIDASGEARFAKGLLDAVDSAFTLNGWKHADQCMTFTCQKMRNYTDEVEFTSTVNWETLKIGPKSALKPPDREEESTDSGEKEKAHESLPWHT